jgi:hypothetical protein
MLLKRLLDCGHSNGIDPLKPMVQHAVQQAGRKPEI